MLNPSKTARDNRANQLNPNNAAYKALRCESKPSSTSSNPSPAKPKRSIQHRNSRRRMSSGRHTRGRVQ